MDFSDILRYRLYNQQLSHQAFQQAGELVKWLGAVQSQDYAAAKWALGLRLPDSTEAEIEKAFAKGKLLRTHVMRPTWHFVVPEDIRWMLELTAPRVKALSAFMNRKLELDEKLFLKSRKVLEKAMQNGEPFHRKTLNELLNKAGIPTDEQRFIHIMMRAELDAVVCSGPRDGKQFTYMLLEQRAPGAKILERDEALAELSTRYFTSHGPATAADFSWWSGLTVSDVKRGIELSKDVLDSEEVEGQTFWFSRKMSFKKLTEEKTYLLPWYDEYLVGYKDRSALFDEKHTKKIQLSNIIFNPSILINGKAAGTWKRTLKKDSVLIETNAFTRLNPAAKKSVLAAAKEYSRFTGVSLRLSE